ncbi:hypothetical protein [Stappia sp.]|uniref:hypothetical protein n=1 Tax=Stappia sp. TaxID=1870903 RepID=UPI003A9962ED
MAKNHTTPGPAGRTKGKDKSGPSAEQTSRGWMNPVGPDPVLYPDPPPATAPAPLPPSPPASGTVPIASGPAEIGSGTVEVGSGTVDVGSGTPTLPKAE